MYKYILAFTIIIFVVGFCSCSESTPPSEDAVEFKIATISTTPGNEWFIPEKNGYTPDSLTCSQIKSTFNPNVHKLYFYCSFTCGCAQKQLNIPHCFKALDVAGITETSYEIYSMNKVSATHPHMGKMNILKIPEVYIVKNGEVIYSVLDTMDYYINQYNRHRPVEELILEGLKK